MRFPAVACLFALMTFRIPSRKVWIFFFEGLINHFPLYLRRCCPRKLKPFSMGVTSVFSWESVSPRSFMNCSTRGLTSLSKTSFDLPVTIKSSAKRTKLIFSLLPSRGCFGNFSRNAFSRPFKVLLARTGEQIPPWGVPSSVTWRTCFSMNPALPPPLKHCLFHRDMRQEPLMRDLIERSHNSIPYSTTQMKRTEQRLKSLIPLIPCSGVALRCFRSVLPCTEQVVRLSRTASTNAQPAPCKGALTESS